MARSLILALFLTYDIFRNLLDLLPISKLPYSLKKGVQFCYHQSNQTIHPAMGIICLSTTPVGSTYLLSELLTGPVVVLKQMPLVRKENMIDNGTYDVHSNCRKR
jgi:hypothetical protein